MCGIIAYTGSKDARPILIDGLHRLEYRGYDSAGIALVHRKRIRCWKAAGKISMLEQRLPESTPGHCGIGHTRWATHGAPTDANAHPHTDAHLRIAVAHNGIIENADSLRAQLMAKGVTFSSETDSEVLAHLLADYDGPLIDAMRTLLLKVQGTYGLAAIDRDAPDTVIVARLGSPVILGIGNGEMLAASDMSALARHTQEIIHLDDGEVAELTPTGFQVTTLDARPSQKSSTQLTGALADYDKGGYAHYLHREIRDQVEVVQRTLSGRLDTRFSTAHLGGLLNLAPRDLLNTRRIKILGCGSAYYAGMAGAYMIEELARLPVQRRARSRVSLPQPGCRTRNPVHRSQPVWRDLRHAGSSTGNTTQGRIRTGNRQQRRQHDCPRGRWWCLYARRP